MTPRRRHPFRDETIAPWLTVLVIVGLWWGGATLIERATGSTAPEPHTVTARPAAAEADPPAILEPSLRPETSRERTTANAGDATRSIDDALRATDDGSRTSGRVVIPVAGVQASELRPTFDEARGGGTRRHEALDILAPRGTPVLAAVDGRVAKLFTSAAGGLTIYQFDAAGTLCYYYAHLDAYVPELTEGQVLRQGDVIGYVGTTGNAPPNTPHLHFAIFRLGPDKRWWEGDAIDPFPILR